ncbi:hypothetical protein TorRG33x02_191920 [Trema orientale]|uniref:Uncharacterized protein n=1 Tax=Trema orientale TaxID=63057 RepID=A0A2P5EHB8_TREOI|nr:hypothetical protein TorRG33x02_191920 [Trema orientale]
MSLVKVGNKEIIDYFTTKLDEMEKPGPLKRLQLADVMEYCMYSGFPLLENCEYKSAQLSYDVDGHYCRERLYPFQLGCQFYRLTRDLRHLSNRSLGGENLKRDVYKRDIESVIHSIPSECWFLEDQYS